MYVCLLSYFFFFNFFKLLLVIIFVAKMVGQIKTNYVLLFINLIAIPVNCHYSHDEILSVTAYVLL